VSQFFCPHIDIRPYFVRELVKAEHVKLIPLRTQKTVAGTLMKSLPLPAFIARHKVMLGQVSLSLKFLGAWHTCIFAYNYPGIQICTHAFYLNYMKKNLGVIF